MRYMSQLVSGPVTPHMTVLCRHFNIECYLLLEILIEIALFMIIRGIAKSCLCILKGLSIFRGGSLFNTMTMKRVIIML